MTVYYDDPFWVAVLEVLDGDRVRATRHVFGAEPTDAELYEFLLRHGGDLLASAQQSPAVSFDQAPPPRNPKRMARAAARAAAEARPSTAAQEAVKKAMELRKQASAERGREHRAAHAEHRREMRRAKSRARHRGH
ncbi:YjdF family protein [Actinoplanes sp. NPDC049681]|uniref:YjdF family protein n=1 Tax=Actinoplanes sp. NPDC049681 TaxID=3363905 RepID=UPI00379C5F9F